MNVTIATMAASPSVRNDSPAKLANCSVPGMERHEIGMVYRNDWYRNESFRKPEWSTGCSLKCDYSLIFDDGSIARFHQSMSTAATLLISFSSISLLIYLLTFKSNVRRQLRECSCALSFTFLLIGRLIFTLNSFDDNGLRRGDAPVPRPLVALFLLLSLSAVDFSLRVPVPILFRSLPVLFVQCLA